MFEYITFILYFLKILGCAKSSNRGHNHYDNLNILYSVNFLIWTK